MWTGTAGRCLKAEGRYCTRLFRRSSALTALPAILRSSRRIPEETAEALGRLITGALDSRGSGILLSYSGRRRFHAQGGSLTARTNY
jgi:hypothetical protein